MMPSCLKKPKNRGYERYERYSTSILYKHRLHHGGGDGALLKLSSQDDPLVVVARIGPKCCLDSVVVFK